MCRTSCLPLRVCSSLAIVLGAVVAAFAAGSVAAAAYRYKDSSGQWVYTDRPPTSGQTSQNIALGGSGAVSPTMAVQPRSAADGITLVAINQSVGTVEFAVKAQTAAGQKLGQATVPPKSEAVLLELPAAGGPAEVRYEYGYVVGKPGSEHRPRQPYRAPFAVAQNFLVSQAPPDAITHVDAASRNAVDIAMPVGTAVHAAREGIVLNVAARHYRSGLQPQNMDEANFVQVLHEDGTYAIYAHLQLDTVRVKPGQRVARGEYIANSGNTGFSSGPHLHFVVLRNAGMRSESIPVTFAGAGGTGITPRSGRELTAY